MRTDMRKLPEGEVIGRLQAGHIMTIRRRDDPNLPLLFRLQQKGMVTNRIVQVDEQTSIAEWEWTDTDSGEGS